jgi:hypothetical protein
MKQDIRKAGRQSILTDFVAVPNEIVNHQMLQRYNQWFGRMVV